MANTKITISHEDIVNSPVTLYCDSVKVSGKRSIESKPNANIDGPIAVQTLSFENPTYVIQNIHYDPNLTTLTYADVLSLYKSKYNGSNAATITVLYGSTNLIASDGVSTSIKVVLETFDFPLRASDSKDAYLPVGSLTFKETA